MTNPDWDNPETFSIVVQGSLIRSNLIETANHCVHWRRLFPHTPIILAISVTDIVTGTPRENGVLDDLALVAAHQHNGKLRNALFFLRQACTAVTLADPALSLPLFKKDSKAGNNINFQIAAARAGLALVSSIYVLRVRADLIFADRSFLAHYEADRALPRGHASVLEERVMISWLYTLNPYALERLPLHYSDWFHLGLTRDVTRLWDIPPMPLADATYYRVHDYASGSSSAEKLFLVRLAVEQYLLYPTFKSAFPDLHLDYHNDLRSRDLCMDILIDNFIPCDLLRAGCVFEKYSHEFHNRNKRTQCITAETWRALCHARGENYRTITLNSVKEPLATPPNKQVVRDEFWERYDALQLSLRDATLKDGEIVANGPNGTLIYGPYVTLPGGHYIAHVDCALITGPGAVTLRITASSGQNLLAERTIEIPAGTGSRTLSIPFAVSSPEQNNIEIVLSIQRIETLRINYVDFRNDHFPRQEATLPSFLQRKFTGVKSKFFR
ncbi:hypothetical protein GLI01_05650 [Gluconacetobacter liquefaciens]|uniref:WavE lipopolysaccharide synthesis protein n=1 Tax=Gluconacetobacter liquefaciens TaxID=89584 RepID=A0A370G4W6_GLULI|nr:WavE lipopolysaccharide synthesis family protein [Gluconacetobacter liquefaciens]MBB2186348.1 hypothetical protein [Gluconacetobacter liquefaciens]RDI38891.1 WavE lipopolysaccharide synthesis protein [Gluconacetobacter liquefaciens]GBR05147.1 hypothetical protein AA0522_1974 [Gluconacetobacter liquefaciens NRIC 0522]GEB36530.1 hypothetical protein GLI01_05650 [Gluconacetobacter liquefaciens]